MAYCVALLTKVLSGLPATYQRLLAHKATTKLDRLDAGRLSRAGVAGAPLDPALKRRVEEELGVSLSNAFGITECSPTIAMVRLEDPRPDETVDRVLPDVEVRLVKGDGALAGDGEIGELHVRGPNVMLGYYRAPDLTAAAVDGDGWFRAGDLARSSDGFLYIVGLLQEMIIRSGFNVYPAEIEAVLNGRPAVVQSAVVGRAVDANEEVVAFVQLLPGENATVADVRAYADPLLTAYKRPSRIIALDAFPAGSTGKILKHVLKDRAAALPPEGASGEAWPPTATSSIAWSDYIESAAHQFSLLTTPARHSCAKARTLCELQVPGDLLPVFHTSVG